MVPIYWVVHKRDRTIGRKILSHMVNDTMENSDETRVLRSAVYQCARRRGIVGLSLRRSTRFGHWPARRGATSWRRRKQKGRVDGSSLTLSSSISLDAVVGKRARNSWGYSRLRPLVHIQLGASWPQAAPELLSS